MSGSADLSARCFTSSSASYSASEWLPPEYGRKLPIDEGKDQSNGAATELFGRGCDRKRAEQRTMDTKEMSHEGYES